MIFTLASHLRAAFKITSLSIGSVSSTEPADTFVQRRRIVTLRGRLLFLRVKFITGDTWHAFRGERGGGQIEPAQINEYSARNMFHFHFPILSTIWSEKRRTFAFAPSSPRPAMTFFALSLRLLIGGMRMACRIDTYSFSSTLVFNVLRPAAALVNKRKFSASCHGCNFVGQGPSTRQHRENREMEQKRREEGRARVFKAEERLQLSRLLQYSKIFPPQSVKYQAPIFDPRKTRGIMTPSS